MREKIKKEILTVLEKECRRARLSSVLLGQAIIEAREDNLHGKVSEALAEIQRFFRTIADPQSADHRLFRDVYQWNEKRTGEIISHYTQRNAQITDLIERLEQLH